MHFRRNIFILAKDFLIVSDGDFATAVTTVVAIVVYDAELAGGNAVDGGCGMYHIAAVAHSFQGGGKEFGGVANLQRDVFGWQLAVDAMEAHNGEVLLVGRRRVVAMRDIDDVLLDVFLDDEPRTATQSHAFALADGVKPVALVLANEFACLQLYDIAWQLAQIAAQVVVIVDFAQEADALRVLALGIDQVLTLGNLANLFLHHVTNGEERLLQLPVVDLCQEVGLVLDRVGTGAEPFENLSLPPPRGGAGWRDMPR